MNKIKYLIVFLFCLCPLWAVGQNQVASGTVSDISRIEILSNIFIYS